MKQIIQSFKTGETVLEEIPVPQVRRGCVLIQTNHSLVSLGTEKMLVEFAKSNLISKARQQPDKVKQVLDKIRTDGFMPTLKAVFNKLGEPLPLGYCNVGKVMAIGEGVREFKIGDRVASNGQHAEFVCIPKNLIVSIPNEVSDEEATFTVIGSIGLQGIRLLNPTFGETVAVIGMGLIGLLTAQLLIANGCKVIGIDIDDEKLSLGRQWGVITYNQKSGEVVKFVQSITGNTGADGVIIAASAKDVDIISQAAKMSRKRGRIILIGVIGLNLNRAEFYEKELSFQVSCSYGPGRYDEDYEQRGNDYPLPYVRWTEKRNFEAVLHSIASGRLQVKDMISEVVSVDDYQRIYGEIASKKSIASILKYNISENTNPAKTIELKSISFNGSKGVIGVIGAGNFAKMTMLPALKGRMDGFSYRVPVIDGSIADMSLNLVKQPSAAEINELFRHHAATSMSGIVEYTEEPLVSADILGNTHSSVIDGSLTRHIGHLVKVVAWYDNEVGISNRLAELAVELQSFTSVNVSSL